MTKGSDNNHRTANEKQTQMFDEENAEALEEVSADLSSMLRASTEAIDDQVRTGIGNELTNLFAAVDRAVLNPGFGGLIEIPQAEAQRMVDGWVDTLHFLKETGDISFEVPETFICRMLEDGSLFLKRINLPAGVVLRQEPPPEPVKAPAKKRKSPKKSTKKAATPKIADRTPARAPVATTEQESQTPENQMSLIESPQGAPPQEGPPQQNADAGVRRTLTVGHGGTIQVHDKEGE